MSISSQSKPASAMASALSALQRLSQAPEVGLPAFSARFTGFWIGRVIGRRSLVEGRGSVEVLGQDLTEEREQAALLRCRRDPAGLPPHPLEGRRHGNAEACGVDHLQIV